MLEKQSNDKQGNSKAWLWFGIIYGLMTSFFLWIIVSWLKSGRLTAEQTSVRIDSIIIPIQDEEQGKEGIESQQPDDLTKIEGIGPKIKKTLIAHNIDTFNKLSQQQPEEIKKILDEEKIPLANPETWPDQARYAAQQDWKGLETFQSQLKGGRKVN